ncbi:MAG: hypothetical protein P4L73_01420 [Caulobacteraceae bacterium]|nr:hypothetical protein [Caulobacteraceae bacterium]
MTKPPSTLEPTAGLALEGAGGCECCGEAAVAGRAGRRLERLDELAEIGMALARTLLPEAGAAGPAVVRGDPAMAFSRIARAVRLTLALEARFDEQWRAGEAEAAKARATKQFIRGLIQRDKVGAITREVIETERRERGEAIDAERLLADLDERLEDPSELKAFADRPVSEMVAQICRDLGVAFDAEAWTDEDWAQAEARAEAAHAAEDDDEEDEDGDEDEDAGWTGGAGASPWSRRPPSAAAFAPGRAGRSLGP